MKYIVFDLDDTLLNTKKQVSEKTLKELKRLQEAGHILVINTARGFNRSKGVMIEINADYAICNGGSLIVDRKYNVLFSDPIAPEITEKIALELHKHSSKVSVDDDKYLYCSNYSHAEHLKNTGAVYFDFDRPLAVAAYKILADFTDVNVLKVISDKYGLKYVNHTNSTWFRLFKPTNNKWIGTVWLINYLHANIEDVVSFGDDAGDLEMLKEAHLGVAMANAQPIILEQIEEHTLTNNEDGVVYYLANVLKL